MELIGDMMLGITSAFDIHRWFIDQTLQGLFPFHGKIERGSSVRWC